MIHINRNWVDTRWQQYITYLHTNKTHNREKSELMNKYLKHFTQFINSIDFDEL
jgi:hypothetical protein